MTSLLLQPSAASAYTPSATITSVTGGPLAFTANSMTNSAVTAATLTVSLTYSTSLAGSGGTVSIVPTATLGGTAGNTLDTRDFSVQCNAPSVPSAFTSSGVVALNGTTQCATLPSGNQAVSVTFNVILTLDTTIAASVPFYADTYASTVFSITASAT